jgi:PAS domain S-box-containing protein
VLSVNQFGAEQLGYAPEELAGRPVLEVFYEEDEEDIGRQLQLCMDTPGKMAHWECRKVRKDGEVLWVKEAARATVDVSGELIVLIVCEDITERRRMEEELRKAREELEGKVERQMQRGRAYGLTFRELTVLHLVAAGNSDREMADKLGISPLTVSKHVANILSKMGASSRSEASARAVRDALLV